MVDDSRMRDGALVAAARAGSETAFAELYRRHHRGVLAAVGAILGNPARAEEIAQDAFSAAFATLRTSEGEIAFKPWIHAIAHNTAITAWRRERLVSEVSFEGASGLNRGDEQRLVSAVSDPELAFAARERLDNLWDAFAGLPASQARILAMRELQGMSYREIAVTLKTTRANVHRTLARARRRLEDDYRELASGTRCASVERALRRLAEGSAVKSDRRLAARHVRRCAACRRVAVVQGVDLPGLLRSPLRIVLPLPALLRRGQHTDGPAKQGWAQIVAGNAESAGSLAKLAAVVASATMVGGLGGPVEPAGVAREPGPRAHVPAPGDLAQVRPRRAVAGVPGRAQRSADPLAAAPPHPRARARGRTPTETVLPPAQRPALEGGRVEAGQPVRRHPPEEPAAPALAHDPEAAGRAPLTRSEAGAPPPSVPSAPVPDEPPSIEGAVDPPRPAGPALPDPEQVCGGQLVEHNPRPPRTPEVCGDDIDYPVVRGTPVL